MYKTGARTDVFSGITEAGRVAKVGPISMADKSAPKNESKSQKRPAPIERPIGASNCEIHLLVNNVSIAPADNAAGIQIARICQSTPVRWAIWPWLPIHSMNMKIPGMIAEFGQACPIAGSK